MSYSAIGLSNAKNAINVGHVLRAAGCYGASMVAISGGRCPKAPTDPSASFNDIPVIRCNDLHDVIPYDCVPVAVELIPNSENLVTFRHPKKCFYVFGPEDSSLGQKTLSWCKHIVYIPTNKCLNLSACVNTVLYDRMAKMTRGESSRLV